MTAILLSIAACDSGNITRLPETPIGLQATVRNGAQNYTIEVTSFNNGRVGIKRFWNGEAYSSEQLYRGLYRISGVYAKASFEAEINEDAIDALFPLREGNTTSFEGNMIRIDKPVVRQLWVRMTVVKASSMVINDKRWPTWVIEIQSEYGTKSGAVASQAIIHYSEELGMALKKTVREDGHQYFWRFTDLTLPDGDDELRRAPIQNRGTIMI